MIFGKAPESNCSLSISFLRLNDRKLLEFNLEFMKDKCWNTNLESCFTDSVIQRIKYFEKSEVQTFCLNATITSYSTENFYLLPH